MKENKLPTFSAEQLSAIFSASIRSMINSALNDVNARIDALERKIGEVEGDLHDVLDDLDLDDVKSRIDSLEDLVGGYDINDMDDRIRDIERSLDDENLDGYERLESRVCDLEDNDAMAERLAGVLKTIFSNL